MWALAKKPHVVHSMSADISSPTTAASSSAIQRQGKGNCQMEGMVPRLCDRRRQTGLTLLYQLFQSLIFQSLLTISSGFKINVDRWHDTQTKPDSPSGKRNIPEVSRNSTFKAKESNFFFSGCSHYISFCASPPSCKRKTLLTKWDPMYIFMYIYEVQYWKNSAARNPGCLGTEAVLNSVKAPHSWFLWASSKTWQRCTTEHLL